MPASFARVRVRTCRGRKRARRGVHEPVRRQEAIARGDEAQEDGQRPLGGLAGHAPFPSQTLKYGSVLVLIIIKNTQVW